MNNPKPSRTSGRRVNPNVSSPLSTNYPPARVSRRESAQHDSERGLSAALYEIAKAPQYCD
jgi:hypothetical protein